MHLCTVFVDTQLKEAKAYGMQQFEKHASLSFKSNCALLSHSLSVWNRLRIFKLLLKMELRPISWKTIKVVSIEWESYLAGLGILKISLHLLKMWSFDALNLLVRRYPPSCFPLEKWIKINVWLVQLCLWKFPWRAHSGNWEMTITERFNWFFSCFRVQSKVFQRREGEHFLP